jgi:hypothetical protein
MFSECHLKILGVLESTSGSDLFDRAARVAKEAGDSFQFLAEDGGMRRPRCRQLESSLEDTTTDGKMSGDILHLDSLASMFANPLGDLRDPGIVYSQYVGRLSSGDT